jgi:histidinol phosphatase-like enzyme (inositol monophosphatase family)
LTVSTDFLRHLAEVAAAQTLPRFRTNHLVDNKVDGGFDPVTEADREAECAIRAAISAAFPDHGILGEEFGQERAGSDNVWIIDPIDGTRAFISGIPVWGTLVGFVQNGRATAGLMSQPFTGELFVAGEDGAFHDGPAGRKPLQARRTKDLAEAIMFTTTPSLFKDDARDRYDTLEGKVRLARYGTDCYAFAMLAAGHVDIVADPGLQSYDIAALIPLIERAGGVVTTFTGDRAENGGDILAAATPELHAAALDMLAARS